MLAPPIRLSRATRLVAVTGFAVGLGFAASSVFAASPTASSSAPSGTSSTAPARNPGTAPLGGKHGHGPKGGGGTITAINGSTLSLRTEQGTETVTTSSSTTYTKEQQSISIGGLHVGDIVHVAGTPTSTSATPGTGTVAATAVAVVQPTLAGRVASVSGGTLNLIGKDGRQFTVSVTGSTRYYSQGQGSSLAAGHRRRPCPRRG